MISRRSLLLSLPALSVSCGSQSPRERLTAQEVLTHSWLSIEDRARGQAVSFAMWSGDERRNRFFRGPVTEGLLSAYGIALKIVPIADTVEVINKLLNENQSEKDPGTFDLIWINGENFRTARQGEVLWGPFAESLPHIGLYPPEATERDFGTPIEGWEAPWGRAQFVMGYDHAKLTDPPRTFHDLAGWVQSHPGRFTYPAPPDFTGSAFIRHVLLAQAPDASIFTRFDERAYDRLATAAIRYLRELRTYLWRGGETYPANPVDLNRLFANSEISFTMSYNPFFAAERIERVELPATTRTFVWQSGSLANYNYLAIPFNAPSPAASLTVINHLIGFDSQLALSKALGTPFPIPFDQLTKPQQEQVESLPRHPSILPERVLQEHAIPEPDAEYLVRLEKDWQRQVLRA